MKLSGSYRQSGFSLLEILVAFSIMALALGALYRAAGGSVRGAMEVDYQSRAILLAQSMLVLHPDVPTAGIDTRGRDEATGMDWRLVSAPYLLDLDPPPATGLHRLEVEVEWGRDGRRGHMGLVTLVPERKALP